MLAACALLALAILAVDVALPRGIAVSTLHAAVVVLALWSPRRADLVLATIAGTLLAIAGYLLSPPTGGPGWIAIANHLLALAAISITAWACWRRVQVDRHLMLSEGELAARTRELRRAGERAAADELRFSVLADNVPALFAYVGADRRFRFANKAFEELFGIEREAIPGQHMKELLGERGYALVEKRVEAALAGLQVSFEVDVPIEFSGTRRMSVRCVPDLGPDERVRGFFVLAVDLTEGARAAAALRDREARLRAILDSVIDGIVAIDARGRIESLNPAAERLFGWRAAEVIGRNVNLLMPSPWHAEHDGYIERYLRTGERRIIGIGREVEGRRRDGTTFPLFLGVSEIAGPERRFTAVLHDLSARKAAEEELRRERDFLENLIDVVPLVVLVLDPEGRVVRYNRYLERLAGRPLGEARGLSWFDAFLPERDRARIRGVFARALRGEESAGTVNPILARDGSERLIEWHNALLRDASGATVGVLATGLDITARRLLEEELRQAQKMEAVGRLAGGIAHDFNNLLMGVLGGCRMAAERLGAGDAALPFVEEIRGAAERGTGLTRQLMAFSRRRTVAPRPTRINETVSANEGMIRRLVGEDIAVVVELCSSGAVVLGDAGQLEQVLMNLVVNARDAMPKGGRLTIRTSERAGSDRAAAAGALAGPHAVLEVADTGCGMDARTRERAFEPFFTTKPEGQGTGLGLATVYAIVQQLGGHIHLESEPGRGTTFRIHLPSSAEPLAAAEAAADAGPAAPAPATAGATVLLVEDEGLVRAAVRHILKGLGYRVVEAADGAEALAACERLDGALDLLLTDMVMPGMDGSRLAREIAARKPGARVLFMSAYPEAVLVEQGRIEPGQATLEKPFDEEALAARVREVLAGRTAPDGAGGQPWRSSSHRG